jgi:hypothetical protein
MQKQKGISTLVGIIIIVVAAAVIFGGVFAWQYFAAKSQPKVVQTQTQTAGWKTYGDNYGFQMQYPDDKEINAPKSQIITCNGSCPDTQLVDNVQAKFKNETINGVNYCVYEGGDCGMGTCLSEFLYVTVKNNTCYGLDI